VRALLAGQRGQRAIGRQRQPAKIDQHRRTKLRPRGLVNLDAGAALAQLVVQQHRARNKPQSILYPVQGIGRAHRLGQRHHAGACRRQLRQHVLLFVHALQLPTAQHHEHRRHGDGEHPSGKDRVLSRHDKPAASR
jgi:hypothetical protein